MKLATSFILGLAAQQQSERSEDDERYGYGAGGCSQHTYGWSPDITCKIECKGVQKVGKGNKAGLAWVLDSEDTLAIKLANNKKSKPNPQPKPKQPYIGFIRLDEKNCPEEVMDQLEYGYVKLDIGDKYYDDDIEMCSRTRVVNDADTHKLAGKSSLLYQFKKKSWHATEAKKNFDAYTVVMTNIADAQKWSNATHADYKNCLQKAFVYAMKDDGLDGEESNDYTKCILYNEFGMDIDWTEEPPATTSGSWSTGDWSSTEGSWSSTEGSWSSTGSWTTAEPDPADLIPAGVKCQANPLQQGVKIVGGSEAEPHSWRWMASLRIDGWHYCGGSILNDRTILSAAHCCTRGASDYTIRIGDHSQSQSDGETEYEVARVIQHPEYGKSDGYTYNWDFCIMETKTAMKLDGMFTDIVCLPDQDDHVDPSVTRGFVGDKCFVAGWGTLSSGGSMPDKLQSVKVAIYGHDYCLEHSAYGDTFHEKSEFCAGVIAGGEDSCQGDSGGPLICINDQNEPVLTGAVSWGYGCAAKNYPGIYAKVSAVTDWIVLTVNGGSTTSKPDTMTTTDNSEEFEEGELHLPAGMGGECDGRKRRFTEDGNNKIAGGQVVEDDVWLWIALMNAGPGNQARCTGSILNDDWIVTAGHCCDGMDLDQMHFVIGEYNKKEGVHDKGQFNVKALQMIVHEEYGAENGISNDICLVKVENMNDKKPNACKGCYQPICLPHEGEHAYPGKHCWVAGWGATTPANTGSNKLRDIGLNVMSTDYCRETSLINENSPTGEFLVQDDVEFCAGIPDRDGNGLTDAGKGVCAGDGGGPLVCVNDGKAILNGMVSWSFGCGAEGNPTVFTKMSAFRSWIETNMKD